MDYREAVAVVYDFAGNDRRVLAAGAIHLVAEAELVH
jgi:hypothetical protein